MMEFPTADGKVVTVNEDTKNKMTAHPDVWNLLPEALSKLTIQEDGRFYKTDVDLGRIIGVTTLVDTPDIELETPTHFAYRKERKFPTHISPVANPKSCTTVALSLHKDESTNQWMLTTAYIGRSVPHEPFYYFDKESWFYRDEKRFQESLSFWIKHALAVEDGVTGEPYKSTWREELEKIENQTLT